MNSNRNAIQMMGALAASSPLQNGYAFVSFARTLTDACCSVMRKILRTDEVEETRSSPCFSKENTSASQKKFRVPNHHYRVQHT